MSYRLMVEKKAIKEMKALPANMRERIKEKIRGILTENPFSGGKGDKRLIVGSEFMRLRVGDYRVFYDVDSEKKVVFILAVRHRSQAYQD